MDNKDFLLKAKELKNKSVKKETPKKKKKKNRVKIVKRLNILFISILILSFLGIMLSFAIQDVFEYSGIEALNQISISGVDISSDVGMITMATTANKNAPLLLTISTIILISCIGVLIFINSSKFSKIIKNDIISKGSKTYINYFFRINLEKKNEEK